MRKLLLTTMLSLVVFCGFAQGNKESEIRTHEIGLDVFDLAVLRSIDVSYEFIKNPELGFGLAARYCFDDASDTEKYSVTPFFRYYFFNKQDYGSKGFYAETFLKSFGGEYENYDYYDYYSSSTFTTKSYFDMAIGVGLGFKFVSKKGFVLDINLGGGRSFGISDYSPEVTGRGGITFGYRF